MTRTVKIKNLSKHIGEIVAIKGWLSIIRDQKKRQFLIIRDITGSVQVVSEKEGRELLSRNVSNLTVESTIKVVGKIIKNEKVKLGGIELALDSIETYSIAEVPLPIDDSSSQEKRLD